MKRVLIVHSLRVDIGYGNYILTAPDGADPLHRHRGHHHQHGSGRSSREMKATTKKSSRAPRYSKSFFEQDDKGKAEQLALNVPELMATSNTLTHPDNFQDRQKRRAEEL